MRCSWIVPCVVLVLGCQRLDEEGPSPTSLGGDGTIGDDDGDGDGGSTTFTPIPPGDEGSDDGSNPSMQCDPVAQTGCTSGQRCTAISNAGAVSFVCVGASGGDLQPLDPCEPDNASGDDACPPKYVCLGNEDGAGVCVGLCRGDGDCEAGVCGEHPDSAIPYCADDCSPFESACVGVMQCRRSDERFSCQFPNAEDNGGPLAECNANDDAGCGEGLVCIAGALVPGCTTGACCTEVCDTNDGGCAPPTTCTPVFGAPAPGYESIGACFVPS